MQGRKPIAGACRLLRGRATAFVMAMAGLLGSLPVSAGVVPAAGLAAAVADLSETSPHAQAFSEFYASREYRPLWFEGGQASPRAGQLLQALDQAAQEGLYPEDYQPSVLHVQCLELPPADLSACELAFSTSFLRYAQDVGYGALRAAEVDQNWHIPQRELPARELLEQVAASEDLDPLLAQLPPPHPAYRELRHALADYRAQRQGPDWPLLPPGPSLKPGDQGPHVALLRQRLGLQYPQVLNTATPDLYDNGLVAAVERYQETHGLDVDGIVGRNTRAALNVPRDMRIAQIALNMERWRWLPRELGESHILVNIAGFHLTLVQPGHTPLRLRTISGRPDRTSLAFQSRISHLVLNPDWTVPRRLAVEDLLPQLQQDPLALVEKQIRILRREEGELVEVDPAAQDWQAYNKYNFPFLLRQSPGPHNSLGQVKFMMPNPYAIYIHDTPAKGLFRKSVRTLSSGCIRVDRALDLATRVLGGEDHADRLMRSHLETGETVQVPIRSQIAVYLVYLTAWVDEQGNLYLQDDVYGRDVPLLDRFSLL